MTRPTNPNISIPANFAENGQKTDFTEEKILNGFNYLEPDVLPGDNLNKFIDDTYKGLTYAVEGVTDLYNMYDSGSFVNKSGDTMSGSLNFLNNGYGVISFKNISTGGYSDINFIQANDNRVGFIRANNVSATDRNIQITACDDNGTPTVGLSVGYNGGAYVTAPTPANNSNDTKVATTAWVNAKLSPRLYLKSAYENGLSGYVIYSNGYCEQWGAVHGTASVQGDKTITFLKTFNNTNYNFMFSYTNNNSSLSMNDNGYEVHTSRTTNSVVLHSTTNVHGFSWRVAGFLASGQY